MGQGLEYIWYKDGVAITTATVDDHIYTINAATAGFEGDYQVEISGAGTCTERSAAITITNAGNFTVTRDNPENLVLLPSQTQNLSVTTDATSPTYQWYRNGTAIAGETTSTLATTEVGDYYAEVSQGSGGACSSTVIASETTSIVAPASFDIVIDYTTAYNACEQTEIALNVTTINAIATDGTVTDVTADLLASFTYQWKKDGVDVAGETSSILNTVFCSAADDITLSSVLDLTGETFEWTRDGTAFNTTDTAVIVNEPGVYQLNINRGGCPIPSNEINIAPLDPSLISFDTDDTIIFPEGTSRTVTASGGTAYQWFDATNTLVGDTASLTVDQEGTYMLIASVDNCQVTRELTVEYLDAFKIPNVISVNGDGINDQWTIPNSYSNQADINVIIYNDQGEEVVNEFSYQNNWPSSGTAFPKQNMIFYYTIRNNQEILKQGTITVIR